MVLTLASLYVLLYAALSLPAVQNWARDIACGELNKLTGGTFSIERVRIYPFNKLQLEGVNLLDDKGEYVASIKEVGAGIAIIRLITEQKVIITFGQITGLDGQIVQKEKDGPLNIQFLIDAFAPKDKNKPPKKFDLQLNNIVLRDCNLRFDRDWQPRLKDKSRFDVNHVNIKNLRADLRLPVMRNDDFVIDLRRLAFAEGSGFELESLQGHFIVNAKELSTSDLRIKMPGTFIAPGPIHLEINGFKHIAEDLLAQPLSLQLINTKITPSDFKAFLPVLANYSKPLTLTLQASYYHDKLKLEQLGLIMQEGVTLHTKGELSGLRGGIKSIAFSLPELKLKADGTAISGIITDFASMNQDQAALIRRLGSVNIDLSIAGNASSLKTRGFIEAAPGTLKLEADAKSISRNVQLVARVITPGFDLGRLLDNNDLGIVIADADADLLIGKGLLDGHLAMNAPRIHFRGYDYLGLRAELQKHANELKGNVAMADENVNFTIEGEANLDGANTHIDILGNIANLRPAPLNLATGMEDAQLSGAFDVCLHGNNIDNINGYADFSDIRFSNNKYKDIALNHVRVESHREQLPYSLTLDCDAAQASVEGDFNFKGMVESFRQLLSYYMPSLTGPVHEAYKQNYSWDVKINHNSELLTLVKMPITLLQDLEITGTCNSSEGKATLSMDVPYLQQGKDKLIRNTKLNLDIDTAQNRCDLLLTTLLPNKKGDIDLKLLARAAEDKLNADINWDLNRARSYKGHISLSGMAGEKIAGSVPLYLQVNPSEFTVNDTVWTISPARLSWVDKVASVEDLRVGCASQWAEISGRASADPQDEINVDLENIDLDYVFETLAINYVTFGGRASGRLTAANLFSQQPRLLTDGLNVEGLTYNNSLLGNALIKSHFDTREKAVHIDADIREGKRRSAKVDGAIYVARDSLSIGIEADSVNVAFLQPFMAAFCSDIQGRASGKVHLFGTFRDIDLTGRVHADELRMKVDVTNTYYSATDSVIMDPGCIRLNNITLRDRDGHTALLNGEVRHKYFHDPTFDFAITKAKDFLCYDTDASMGDRWWGTIYGSGSGSLHGVPGYISVVVDMSSDPRSTFTFVLDDHEDAVDYNFVTFTDKRREAEELRIKEQLEAQKTAEPDFLERFRRKAEIEQQGPPTRYDLDLRMRVTPDAKVTIVMDPVAGDRILATGNGALRMTYNSDDELGLYGTYTLAQGMYNFTLQDLIVRDFKIREGSRITFNGDPLQASLNLTAAYRVNTSLTELDKSFANDRELNRTNVPVEALLKVDGEMQKPEITFDLDFPTLSQDVAGKVKSIISTSDMMNRQIIYLLALNRFYTPDYMNGESNNNELASVASTTVSTQLGQILGQIAPGWTFSPYFRTDKGDFSDMEVDLTLSSALFNNRLLLNGNLGYRDRSTSNTTFVGDFDLEYLLNPAGTLRLRAYNHFNDQNYYLRSALTTQGLGIVFKRDFNRFLPGLFRRRKADTTTTSEPAK